MNKEERQKHTEHMDTWKLKKVIKGVKKSIGIRKNSSADIWIDYLIKRVREER